MLWFLLLFVIYEFVWTFFNGDLERRGLLNIVGNNVQLSSFFIIIIIYNTQYSERFIDVATFIINVTIVIAAIVSIVQVFNSRFLLVDYNRNVELVNRGMYEIRRSSIFGYNANEIGLGYIPLFSSIVGVLYLKNNRVPFLFLVLGGITAFLTNTRYVMVGYLLLSMQFAILYRKRLKKLIKYFVIAILLFFILIRILGSLGYDFKAWYQKRLFAEGSIEETTRFKAIDNFLLFFPEYYLFGNGGGLTDEIEKASRAVGSSQIHVGYLSALVYYGIVGSFFLFGFWFYITKKFYKTGKDTGYWGSFFAMLTFLWAQATLVHFTVFFYGLIYAFVFDKYFQDKYYANQLITINE